METFKVKASDDPLGREHTFHLTKRDSLGDRGFVYHQGHRVYGVLGLSSGRFYPVGKWAYLLRRPSAALTA